METTFYPMNRKPTPEKTDDPYSASVLVYELDPVTKKVTDVDIGYYDYGEEEWSVLGDNSMRLSCWCKFPNPEEFMKDKDWEPVTHKGYRE